MIKLTLEQQFVLRAFETKVEKMSLEQAQFFLKELYKQMLVRESMYQELLRKNWNIEGITDIKQWKNE